MIKKISLISLVWLVLSTSTGFTAKIIPLPDLKRAEAVAVNGDRMYISEGPRVFIYSLKKFKLEKIFGRKGEGPGEFKIHPYRGLQFHLQTNDLIVDSYGKLSFFTKQGVLKHEIRTLPSMGTYVSLGDGYVGLGFIQDDKVNYFTINLFNLDFKSKREIYRYKHPYQPGKNYNPLETTKLPAYATWDNQLFLSGEESTILVFDHTGKPLDPIRFPYNKIKITGERKNYYLTCYKTDPKFKPIYQRDKKWIEFPEYFPVIRNLLIADGKIYVVTYGKRDGKNELLVLTIKGQLQHLTFVPLQEENAFRLFPYTIKHGMLYQVSEDEKEEILKLQVHRIPSS